MNDEKRNFDQEAASWDEKPDRVRLAKDIAQAVTEEITLAPDMDVLDFGCGTGLLSLQLQPFVRTITGVDSSPGMLDVLKAKIRDQKLRNVETRYLDIEAGGLLSGSYNLIVSSMTLHHIKDIKPLLDQFHKILMPAGKLGIADLDLDYGQFHNNKEGVFHPGFDREVLRQAVKDAQFGDIRYRTAARIIKPISAGAAKEFTVFLLTCSKNEHHFL
jgi:ubiquinone/menaquinone biosynthesis C-methylase UbiE